MRDKYLDQGHGECHLAKPDCAEIVLESLQRFDTERYFLTDAIVMPNHAQNPIVAGLPAEQCLHFQKVLVGR